MTAPVSALGFQPFAAATGSTPTPAKGVVTTTPPPGSTVGNASSSMQLDPQAFLQLLVAQLQYQDPTNPVDTSSFMNQTAMLSQVQTMTSMSSTLSALSDAQQAQSATALIGKQVTYLDANGMRVSGVVSSASLLSSGATLRVGDASVPLASILEVSAPPAQ
jgi:flagellar basal-body rod modification protein FlgD